MTRDPFYQLAGMLRQQGECSLLLAELVDRKNQMVAARGRQDVLQGHAAGLEISKLPQGSMILCLDSPEGLFALCHLVTEEEGA